VTCSDVTTSGIRSPHDRHQCVRTTVRLDARPVVAGRHVVIRFAIARAGRPVSG